MELKEMELKDIVVVDVCEKHKHRLLYAKPILKELSFLTCAFAGCGIKSRYTGIIEVK